MRGGKTVVVVVVEFSAVFVAVVEVLAVLLVLAIAGSKAGGSH